MFARLINGALQFAPNKLTVGNTQIWNAPNDIYLSQGWKEIVFTEVPEAPEGYYYESGWEEQSAAILQKWTLTKMSDDIDEYETFKIIMGEE